jgi:hypothetical protein
VTAEFKYQDGQTARVETEVTMHTLETSGTNGTKELVAQ